MIMDTTFIIDIMNKDEHAVSKAQELEKSGERQIITTPTIFELWSGLERSNKSPEEKKKILEVLHSQHVLNLDRKSAEEAGRIDAVLINEGMRIDPEDCMIAGIAKAYGEKLLTRNLKHFNRIKGLGTDTY